MPQILEEVPASRRDQPLAPLTASTIGVRAEAGLATERDKATVRKFAETHRVDEAIPTGAQEDRDAVALQPRRVVANPMAGR